MATGDLSTGVTKPLAIPQHQNTTNTSRKKMNNNKHDKHDEKKVKICIWVNLSKKPLTELRPKVKMMKVHNDLNPSWDPWHPKELFGVENFDTTSHLKSGRLQSWFFIEVTVDLSNSLNGIDINLEPDSKESTREGISDSFPCSLNNFSMA